MSSAAVNYDASRRLPPIQSNSGVVRMSAPSYSSIRAQKRLLAMMSGDARWANARPPLTAMPEERGHELAAILKREFEFGAVLA